MATDQTTKKTLTKLANLSDQAGATIREAKVSLDQARALNWALSSIYGAPSRGGTLEQKILACVERGLEVAHVSEAHARLMPSNDHVEWFSGPGWYVDLKPASDVTYPIGPFESAAEAWDEAFIAYGLGGGR